MTKSGLKLGFIGLGVMGAPMAGHLLNAGHVLYLHTRSKVAAAVVEGGATLCTTASRDHTGAEAGSDPTSRCKRRIGAACSGAVVDASVHKDPTVGA